MSRVSIVRASMVAMLCLSSFAVMSAQLPEPDGGTIERGTLPAHWLSQGSKCMEIPEWQVHEYNPNFIILRQSPCSDYEKPFIFLFFGKDKALLADTGEAWEMDSDGRYQRKKTAHDKRAAAQAALLAKLSSAPAPG